MPLTSGNQHRQRPTVAIGSQVQLGGQPASATTQGLVGLRIGS
jgi:hypothetical protein